MPDLAAIECSEQVLKSFGEVGQGIFGIDSAVLKVEEVGF